MKKIYWIPALIVLVCFIIYTLFSYHHYTILVDAGSNGSRLYIYEYDNRNDIPVIHDVYTENTEPGLSSYASHPQAASTSLDVLLDHANHYLYRHFIFPFRVTISLYSTAGMRLIPLATQQMIYNSLRDHIQKNYYFKLGKFETITGKEEALYGWLDINYLDQRFQKKLATLGSIEVGGASAQIAFETESKDSIDDIVILTLNHKKIKVFSRSFLGLGNVQSLQAINKKSLAKSCYPKNYPLDKTVGDFNFKKCKTLFNSYLQTFKISSLNPLLKDKSFVAYSAIYHALNFFEATRLSGQAKLSDKIQSVCNRDWDTLQTDYPSIKVKHLGASCANGVYVNELLFSAYQLNPEQLVITNNINQENITWTLGKIFFDLTQAP